MSLKFIKSNTVLQASNVSYGVQALLLPLLVKASMDSLGESKFISAQLPCNDGIKYQSYLGLFCLCQLGITSSQKDRTRSQRPSSCHSKEQHSSYCLHHLGCNCTDFDLHRLYIQLNSIYPQQVLLVPALSPNPDQSDSKQRCLTWSYTSSTLSLLTSSTFIGHSTQPMMTNPASIRIFFLPLMTINQQYHSANKILKKPRRRIENVLLLYFAYNISNSSRAVYFQQIRSTINHKFKFQIMNQMIQLPPNFQFIASSNCQNISRYSTILPPKIQRLGMLNIFIPKTIVSCVFHLCPREAMTEDPAAVSYWL